MSRGHIYTFTLFAASSQQCFSLTPNHQQPASSIFFTQQISTSHSTANRVLLISVNSNLFKKFATKIHFWNFHSFQNFTISFIQSQDILFMFPQKWKTSVYQVILVFNQFLPMFAMKLLSFDTSASLLIYYTSIKPHIDHLRICRCSSMH